MMERNESTRQKLKELLSSDAVINSLINHFDATVNDDMFNGCTLVAEITQPGHSPHMQLQVRLTRSKTNYFSNHHNEAPQLLIDKNLT